MQTREKLGAQAKKMLKILSDFKGQIIDGYKVILTCRDLVLPDIKKLIELLFIFEGLGFITRISKKRFIYSGLKGMTARILEGVEFALTRTLYDREHWLFSEDYIIENKKYSIRQSVYFGLFYQEIITQIFSNQGRMIARDTIEKLVEQLQLTAKEQSSALIINEMASIMTSLNLLDKRSPADSYETYLWIGPDILHQLMIEQLNPYSLQLKEQLQSKVKLNFEKESTYISNLFRDLVEFQVQDNEIKMPLVNFPTAAYALLKGKHITYYIKKLAIIIGRANQTKNSKYFWEVDLALDLGQKISKQHAVISYNIEKEYFEIKCLSTKKPIDVDSVTITSKDNPVILKHRSSIQIGKFILMFYLPKFSSENQNQEITEQNMVIE
ncbi:unnamed protein product [Paramecium sonneborni]|uniref:FHA domain-containing protein n=1 Tax=Paramecium sonneborni TaxID=65129 RepID=A0A8S1JW88_9CILI|nr:unnamed protein product [Paramecium sonneborni]